MYTYLLQEAKAYADAVDCYWAWMHESRIALTRQGREESNEDPNRPSGSRPGLV